MSWKFEPVDDKNTISPLKKDAGIWNQPHFWQLGNTTVRSAMRLRDGLIAIQNAKIQGNLRGKDGDEILRNALGQSGVVSLGKDVTISAGRKWRAAMCALGFLYDDYGKLQGQIGKLDYITPSGNNLIKAESLAAQQECYLRALSGRRLDKTTLNKQRNASHRDFSPMCHVLGILSAIQEQENKPGVSLIEFELFIQTTTDSNDLEHIVTEILSFRSQRLKAQNKKGFDTEKREEHRQRVFELGENPLTPQTYRDYGDMNLRYLRATGLFGPYTGRGILLKSDTKSSLIKGLLAEQQVFKDDVTYWKNLTNSPTLPIDKKDIALEAFRSVSEKAQGLGLQVSTVPMDNSNVTTINLKRHNVEADIQSVEEEIFASNQINQWEEIVKYMKLLETNRLEDSEDENISIPKGEKPAYFEWVLWRSFLAIDHLMIPASEARGFKIDQDMRPLGHAGGGKPDCKFVFSDFVLVVEVTLTNSDRQYGTEGKPVQRHVLDIKKEYPDLPVHGLFLAPKLDPNTLGIYTQSEYWNEKQKWEVLVTPLKIRTFRELFTAMCKANCANPSHIYDVVQQIQEAKSDNPFDWEAAADDIVSRKTLSLIN